jgi:hypothetical protein
MTTVLSVACAALVFMGSGCYAGLAAAILGISSATSGGSSGKQVVVVEPAPPVVQEFESSWDGTPDRILLQFRIAGGGPDPLAARVEFERLGTAGGGTAPLPATPLEGSGNLTDLRSGQTVRFFWDAKTDLRDESATVRVIITPFTTDEGGQDLPAEPFVSTPFRAGNTPVEVENLLLDAQGASIRVFFDLLDAESDRVNLETVEVIVSGDTFPLPQAVFRGLRKDFLSGPRAVSGVQGSLSFLATALDRPEYPPGLRRVGQPGFEGTIGIRILLRDFPGEPQAAAGAEFRLDLNQEPTVELLEILPEDLVWGLVPIRYRLHDVEKNPADLLVEVAPTGGTSFMPASEFPSAVSSGSRHLPTYQPEVPGGPPAAPAATFLWDVAAQFPRDSAASLRMRAKDLAIGPVEPSVGPKAIQGLLGNGLTSVREVPIDDNFPQFQAVADFNGDGYPDLAVLTSSLTPDGLDSVTWFAGGPADPLDPSGPSRLTKQASPTVGRGGRQPVSGYLNDDRFPDLVVANSISLSLSFLAGGSGGLPAVPVSIDLSSDAPESVVAGDFNHDNFDDLAVMVKGRGKPAKVLLLRGGASGPPGGDRTVIPFDESVSPLSGLGAGDFDGDGSLDLVVYSQQKKTLIHLPGVTGGLPGAVQNSIELNGATPQAILAAGLDGTPPLDLAVTLDLPNSGAAVRVFSGGPAGLTQRQEIPFEVSPRALVVADFDGDGHDDLAAAAQASRTLTIHRGAPGGFSVEASTITLKAIPSRLTAGDLNLDGFADLLAPTISGNTGGIAFLPGGPGGLSESQILAEGSVSEPLVIADFDGDGFPDSVALNRATRSVIEFGGTGPGPVLARRITISVNPLNPERLILADFDRDGFLDLLALSANVNAKILFLLRGGADGFSPERRDTTTPPFDVRPVSLLAADFDGDGFPDVAAALPATASSFLSRLSFLRGGPQGLGAPGAAIQLLSSRTNPIIEMVSGDHDGDGFTDLVLASNDQKSLLYFRGGSDLGLIHTRKRVLAPPLPDAAAGLATGDFNGDGFPDVAVAIPVGQGLVCFLGEGDAIKALTRQIPIPVGIRSPTFLIAGDFNGDGLDDLVAAGDAQVVFLPGATGGDFGSRQTPRGTLDRPRRSQGVASADFDGDGFLNLAVANQRDTVTLFRGGPDGLAEGESRSLLPEGKLQGRYTPWALASGDFDGDGFPDLLATVSELSGAVLLRGGETGLRRAASLWGGEKSDPHGIAAGRFDALGLDGAVLASFGNDEVAVLRQRYLVPHANVLVDPAGPEPDTDPPAILDPRSPAHYRLELKTGSLTEPTQVCLVPARLFGLPGGEAAARGKYLVALTGTVAILRETTPLERASALTIRLREGDPKILDEARANPGALRVYRSEASAEAGTSGAGQAVLLEGTAVEIVPFERGFGARFPIERFGTYLVALEKAR